MLRWLEIEDQKLALVFDSSANPLAGEIAAFSFDEPAEVLPVAPFRSWSGPPDQPPSDVDAFLSGLAWRQRIDRRHDRIVAIDYQSFAAESAVVEYELLGRRASVEVKAWNHSVVKTAESAAPLRRRLRLLGAGSFGAISAGFLLASWYGGQHSFLAASAHQSLLLVMALVLGLVVLWPLSRLGFAGGKTRRWSWLPAVLVAGAQAATAATGYPSLSHALLLEGQGQSAAALTEAAACADLRRESERCAELHDRLLLAAAQAARTPQDAWRAAAEPFYDKAARRQAEDHARELTVATALSLEADRRFADLEALLLEAGTSSLRGDPRFFALLTRRHRRQFEDCFPRLDPYCAREALARAAGAGIAEADLAEIRQKGRRAALEALAPRLRVLRSSRPFSERLAACKDIETVLAFLDTVEPGERLRKEIWDQCQTAESGQRQAERKAREREAAIEVRRRASRGSASLLCRDGTLSPTCVCGGPRRGCCSHHGGVAGCSE